MAIISKLQRSEKEQLQPLLDFLDTDIDRLDEREFLTLVWDYLKFIKQSDRNFIDTQLRFQKLTEGLMDLPESNTLRESKKILKGLQKHLRSIIERIIKSRKIGESGLVKSLVTMTGTRTVAIDIESDRFVEEFIPKLNQPADKINLRTEKSIAETILADMLRDYELKPKRFSFCVKEGCDNILYKFDLRQEFCSDRCSGADRQKRYQSEQKDKKKQPKKGRKT